MTESAGVGGSLNRESSPPSLLKGLFIDDFTEVREGGSSGRCGEQRWNRLWHTAQLSASASFFVPILHPLMFPALLFPSF